jgi:uncharacterized protein (DUF488 family)
MASLIITSWPKTASHGQGRKLTIMARPRHWERGDASIPGVLPDQVWVMARKADLISWEEYEALYVDMLSHVDLREGSLLTSLGDPVRDGDTLLCCCSADKAQAGHCHRVWLARALSQAGWKVTLDEVTCG